MIEILEQSKKEITVKMQKVEFSLIIDSLIDKLDDIQASKDDKFEDKKIACELLINFINSGINLLIPLSLVKYNEILKEVLSKNLIDVKSIPENMEDDIVDKKEDII